VNKPWSDRTDDELAAALRDSRALQDAPEHLIRRAIATFVPRHAAAPAPGLLRRLVATLSFDSAMTGGLALGVRASGGAVRQLLYTVEGRDIDLRIEPAEDRQFRCTGQVLGPDCSGRVRIEALPDAAPDAAPGVAGTADTAATAAPARESALSALGEFRLPPVTAGTYRLTLDLADGAIELPPLRVPQPD
jgi:hypothetical protein